VRLVLDTSVLVAALRSRNGASRLLIEHLAAGHFIAIATPACFLEYEEVLARPEQVSVHGYTPVELDRFLDDLTPYIEMTQVHYTYRPQLRDPDDEFALEAAINGLADAIVTFNTRDFLPAATEFGLDVLTPGRIIRERLRR
jgi:putative PIN family toxin of toxin-antitoxin system